MNRCQVAKRRVKMVTPPPRGEKAVKEAFGDTEGMELDTKSTAGNGDQVEEVSTVGGKLDDGGQETMTGTNKDKRTNNYDGTGVLRSPSVLAPVVENAGSKCTRKEKHTSTYCLNQEWAMLLDKMACGYASEDLGTYGFLDGGKRSQATVYKKPQLDGPQETDASGHQTRQVSIIVQENEGVQHRRSFSGIQVLVRDDLEQGIVDESEKDGVTEEPEAENPIDNDHPHPSDIAVLVPLVVLESRLAWLQVLWAFFCLMNSWGIVNTYGVFQAYFMASGVGNAASVAWIGSMQAFLLLAVAPICGQLFDAGHCRLMIVCGTILVFLGTLATSLDGEFSSSHEHYYWYLMAFQGVITGVGVGLLFTPAVAVVSTYFTRNRGLALGIATSGAGFGGVVYPILTRVVLNAKGFGWSMRSMAFITLITQLLPCILIRQRDDLPRRPLGGKVIDLSCLRSRKFSIFYVGVFVVFLGLFTPYFFVPAWASSVNLRVSFQHFYLLSLINAGGFFGRIIPALAADLSSSPIITQFLCALSTGILVLSWIVMKSTAETIFFCIAYGFFSGAFLALTPVCVAFLTSDMRYFGSRMGLVFAVTGVASLTGNPIAGKLVADFGYTAARIWAGVCTLVGAVIVAAVGAGAQ